MSTYNNSTVENLVKIEESLQNFVIKQTELKKEIKNFSKLNLYKFSKLADISRSSIFNSHKFFKSIVNLVYKRLIKVPNLY